MCGIKQSQRYCLCMMVLCLLAPELITDLWNPFGKISKIVRGIAAITSLVLLLKDMKIGKQARILSLYIVFIGLITIVKNPSVANISRYIAKYADILSVFVLTSYLFERDINKFLKFLFVISWIGIVINTLTVLYFPLGVLRHVGETGYASAAFFYDYDNHFIFKYVPSLIIIYAYEKYYLQKKHGGLLTAIAIGLCVFTLFYRHSIASAFALGAALVFYLLKNVMPDWLLSSGRIWLGYIIVSLILVAFGATGILNKMVLAVGKDASLFVRMRMWTLSLSAIAQAPLTGSGVLNSSIMRDTYAYAQLHNSLLNILLWSGLFGLFIYSGFMASLFPKPWNSSSREDYVFICGLFIALLITSLFDGVELNQNVYLFYAIVSKYACILQYHNETA